MFSICSEERRADLVVEGEAGDAPEQREVRQVVGARHDVGVRVGSSRVPSEGEYATSLVTYR